MKRVFTSHQPNFLPYPSFWIKMAASDIFDIALYDQFSTTAFIDRMSIGPMDKKGNKIVLPLLNRGKVPIKNLLLDQDKLTRVINEIWSYYESFRHAHLILPLLEDVLRTKYRYMWEMNFEFIRLVRDLLSIDSQLVISSPRMSGLNATEDILRLCKLYEAGRYISGMRGRGYLDVSILKEANVSVMMPDWKTPTQNSILTILCAFGPVEASRIIHKAVKLVEYFGE